VNLLIDNKRIIAVIPARGGSKGIPRKNVRFMAGKPLIAYSIENALASSYIDEVVVSTDDDEILHVAETFGAEVTKRPDHLAEDDVPLDPVINHAVMAKEENTDYQIVITLQPTSPLLKSITIDKAIKEFADSNCDTLLSVVDERHLTWTKQNGEYIPNYDERKNRQFLPPNYLETGGILIAKRSCVNKNSRFGDKINLIEVPKEESIDIDTKMDWWVAEKLLEIKKILIRVDGYKRIGLGHIYRTLLLANRLVDHDFIFVSNAEYKLGINMIKDHNYDIKTFNDFDEYEEIIKEYNPDIVINDILDTENNYIQYLKENNIFVVNFEDMGSGAKSADIVINALYDEKYPLENHYWGKDYYCLREEFQLVPKKEIDKEIKDILITFGGTDSHNYTERLINILKDSSVDLQKVKINIVLGLGYENKNKLEDLVENINLDISIMQNIKNISKYMYQADLVFTSAGRTIYELASIGTPTIVLAQNNRELRHRFANSENGIVNLGLGYEVTDREIKETFENIVNDYELRKRCNKLMLKNDLRSGVDNVLKVIFEGYDEYKKEEI
jgi:CMP-N-acetylneuraminic acid synthetase/spore coat polysaccharide biosynthesis predicted glycosyltransferase SpsG